MAEQTTSGVKGETTVRDPTPAQRTVARRTAEARATIPDVEMTREIDVTGVPDSDVSWDARLLTACAQALRAVPQANGAYRDGRFEAYSRINIGVVVTHGDSYLIPTVFDADQRPAAQLGDELVALAAGARARTLLAPAFSGATFTLWNAGALGITRSGIVINPPQAGALACGAVREVPIVRDGQVAPGRVMAATLACDHRVLYGAAAAEFLAVFERALTGA